MRKKTVRILLVEDNAEDVLLTQEVFSECGLPSTFHTVRDGAEALAFLQRTGTHHDAPRPDLILLDLNLPKVNGRSVLKEIKNDPELAFIPVVVLTTSDAPDDIQDAYANHANAYITKPVDLDHFIAAVKSIEGFWLLTVKLPCRKNNNA